MSVLVDWKHEAISIYVNDGADIGNVTFIQVAQRDTTPFKLAAKGKSL